MINVLRLHSWQIEIPPLRTAYLVPSIYHTEGFTLSSVEMSSYEMGQLLKPLIPYRYSSIAFMQTKTTSNLPISRPAMEISLVLLSQSWYYHYAINHLSDSDRKEWTLAMCMNQVSNISISSPFQPALMLDEEYRLYQLHCWTTAEF